MQSLRTTRWIGLLTGWAASLASIGSAAPRVVIETLDDQLAGRLVEWADNHLVLQDDTFARVPLGEALTIRFDQQPTIRLRKPPAGEVVLNNGTRFPYDRYEIVGESIELSCDGGSRLLAPVSSVLSWRLDPTGRFEDDGGRTATADRVLVKNRQGEGATPVDGVILGITPAGVRFALDSAPEDEPVTAPWRRLAAIRFFRTPRTTPPSAAVVTLLEGGRLVADQIAFDASGGLAYETLAGGRGVVSFTRVASIDVSRGRVHPIDELEVLDADWRPYFPGPTSRRGHAFGESLDGGRLALRFPDPRLPQGWSKVFRNREFDHGAALRSRGEVRLALPAGVRRLKGWVGLDPTTRLAGNAEVTLEADRQELWSGTVAGATRPVELNEPLRGERTLTLRVDYGDNLDAGDRVHFADLRVIQ